MSDDRSSRIENKLDKVIDEMGDIKAMLAADQMARKDLARRTKEIEDDLKPIKKHVENVKGGLKLLGLLALVAGCMEGIVTLLGYLKA